MTAPCARPFRARDRDGVIALLARVYAEYGQVLELDTLDADLLAIESVYRAPCRFRVLVGPEEAVLGTAACKIHADGRAELKRVFLDAGLRGRGHGKALVQWAFEAARAEGAREVLVWTDVLFETAHRLYERLGCRDTGETRLLGGRNRIRERLYVLELGGS